MGLLSKLFGHAKDTHPYCSALVPAAGASSRMGGQDKMFSYISGYPVLALTLQALDRCALIDEIVIATRQESILKISDLCRDYGIRKPVQIVEGGDTRAQSVLNAALHADQRAAFFAVHDGARPLVRPAEMETVIRRAYQTSAAAPATPVKDTIKIAYDGVVEQTPDRGSLYAVQTPQVFDASLLKGALQSAIEHNVEITDDCSAVERLGKKVYLVEGSYENIKITTPIDLALAEKIYDLRGGMD